VFGIKEAADIKKGQRSRKCREMTVVDST
jgi:hypothetical protein